MIRRLVIGIAATVLGGLAWAQASAPSANVYRCPGPPVLYTDAMSVTEAREKGCRLVEGTPITVIQMPRPRAGVAAPASAARAADSKVDPSAQRQRDADARRILEDELRREEEKLAALKLEYNNGEPERRGEERNYQRYLDRVSSLKASITRTDSDIAAIKRELAKIAP
jgi:hypothetical protein